MNLTQPIFNTENRFPAFSNITFSKLIMDAEKAKQVINLLEPLPITVSYQIQDEQGFLSIGGGKDNSHIQIVESSVNLIILSLQKFLNDGQYGRVFIQSGFGDEFKIEYIDYSKDTQTEPKIWLLVADDNARYNAQINDISGNSDWREDTYEEWTKTSYFKISEDNRTELMRYFGEFSDWSANTQPHTIKWVEKDGLYALTGHFSDHGTFDIDDYEEALSNGEIQELDADESLFLNGLIQKFAEPNQDIQIQGYWVSKNETIIEHEVVNT